jgi:hypothetical protein
MHNTRRWGGLAGVLLLAATAGCVEHRMVITTEPYGAVVYDEKYQPIGATPADRPFVYYGKYRFTLVKDGYQTLVVEENVKAPWYEVFPLDFVSENLIPYTFRDIRRFHYRLLPAQVAPAEEVLQQGQQLRDRGRTIGTAPLPGESVLPPIAVPAPPP